MKTISLIGLISMAYFVAAIVVLHFLRPDINPIRQATAHYAIGAYGFVMTSAFFSIALASLLLIIGLCQRMSPAARSRSGLVLLGIWVIGVLIAMSFPINPDGMPMTTSGRIHRVSGPLAFLCLTIGVILVSRSFRHDGNWFIVYRPALILSWVMLAFFITTPVSIITKSGLLGLNQRLSLAAFVIWFFIVAAHLFIIAGGQ